MKTILPLAAAVCLAGCAVTAPIAVISDRDGVLRGLAKATLSERTFQVSNERLSCSGSYDPLVQTPTIQAVVQCSDGRKGFAVITRTTAVSGHGTVRLNDGSTANLIFGEAAAAF